MIRTIQDIDPASFRLLNKDYKLFRKAIASKDEDGTFIVPKEIEGRLLVQGLIKKEFIRNRETKTEEETGKFTLTIDAEFYIEYRDELAKKALIQGTYNWITLAIATIALILSIVGIWLDYTAPNSQSMSHASTSETGIITQGEG